MLAVICPLLAAHLSAAVGGVVVVPHGLAYLTTEALVLARYVIVRVLAGGASPLYSVCAGSKGLDF